MPYPFYTIGHSTRTIEEFLDLLRSVRVTLVADVRTVPRSRTNPQYNRDALPQALAVSQIRYEHIPALGGLRGREREAPPSINAFWRNESFHNYADYAMGSHFRGGLARLRELGQSYSCAIMCAEAVWWRCHRRIIADYLLSADEMVFHILKPRIVEPARMTNSARAHASGILTYPVSI
jgi:uncharacterized protein (DUF488 family)